MCQTGGPYCYEPAKKRMAKAAFKYKETQRPIDRINWAVAVLQYNGTPQRQEELQKEIEAEQDPKKKQKLERAKKMAHERRLEDLERVNQRKAMKESQRLAREAAE